MYKHKYYNIYQYYLLFFIIGTIILYGCQSNPKNQSEPEWIDVPINMNEAIDLQDQFNNGHKRGLVDPRQVTRDFLDRQLGFQGDIPLEMTEESDEGKFFRATPDKNHRIELFLIQPVSQGITGIWRVKQYRIIESK